MLVGGQHRAGRVICEQPDECTVGRLELLCGTRVQVRDRGHLARVMRGLKRVPEVRHVQRART